MSSEQRTEVTVLTATEQSYRALIETSAERNTRMLLEERAAIDACDHSRATVEDRDEATDREGKTIGVREYFECPDCPLSDWFDVTDRERN